MAQFQTDEPQTVNDPDGDDYDEMFRKHLGGQASEPQPIFDLAGIYTGDALPKYRIQQFAEPQSVPDPDGAAYDEMLRQYVSGGDDDCYGGLSAGQRETADAAQAIRPLDWRSHPTFGESLIPVWGSTREAVADWRDGDHVGAGVNAVLAASDLIPGAMVAKGLEKAGVRAAMAPGRSMAYRAVRRRMANAGYFAEGQVAHHAIIPQRARWAPDWLVNHPANLKPLEAQVHKRIHGRDLINGLERYDPLQRFWYGTPDWAKADLAQGALSNGVKIVHGLHQTAVDPSQRPPPLM